MIGVMNCTCKGGAEQHSAWETTGECRNQLSAAEYEGKYYITLWPKGNENSSEPQFSYLSKEDALRLAHDLMNYIARAKE